MIARFRPYHHSFRMSRGCGTISYNSSLELNKFLLSSEFTWINDGVQIEASLVLLVIIVVLMCPQSPYSAIPIINILLLVLNIIRNILQCFLCLTVHNHLAQSNPRMHIKQYTIWIVINIFTFLILLCIKICLYIHARTACVTLRRLYQRLLLAISAFVTLLVIALRLAFYILRLRNTTLPEKLSSPDWLETSSNLILSVDICWLCGIVIVRLGLSLHYRRKHGLGRFGPIHIVILTCCQTSVILGMSLTFGDFDVH